MVLTFLVYFSFLLYCSWRYFIRSYYLSPFLSDLTFTFILEVYINKTTFKLCFLITNPISKSILTIMIFTPICGRLLLINKSFPYRSLLGFRLWSSTLVKDIYTFFYPLDDFLFPVSLFRSLFSLYLWFRPPGPVDTDYFTPSPSASWYFLQDVYKPTSSHWKSSSFIFYYQIIKKGILSVLHFGTLLKCSFEYDQPNYDMFFVYPTKRTSHIPTSLLTFIEVYRCFVGILRRRLLLSGV